MTKPFILVCDGMDTEAFEALKSIPELEVHPKKKNTQEEIAALLPKVNGMIIRSATTVNADMIAKAPNLKYVVRAGEGTDNIDKVTCESKGIKVSNTPGANANSAAEHAIALMFTVMRKTAWANCNMKHGGWDKDRYTGIELWKKKVGFVGFGKIGQIAAKRISGFEPEITFFDPTVDSFPGAKKVNSIQEIFQNCDVVTLHLPKNAQTTNLINKDVLSLMKPSAILINAARGGIVNEDDLHEILSNNKIRGAGFDVFATEPLQADSKLRSLENLVMTPHLGASTEEAQIRVGDIAVEITKEFFVNGKLMHEVKAKK